MSIKTAKRVWVKPELSVTNLRDAQTGNNSMAIDQLFPATNGTNVHLS